MSANGKRKPIVFKAYHDRKVEEGMIKKQEIGHLCFRIANLFYTLFKSGQKYDPQLYAAAWTNFPYFGSQGLAVL
ncbi:hypothetical protein NKR74_13855 [Bacillus sp. 3103sda1]|uniref:hypothetical protein n=1 Tax=Bacillus sp. 3103sda1 TaxID=2953808 RepID=UPI00209E09F5|nr:hypothetical protein [Bacillus sp. 3103sda1]MCP1124376.1 hypothetical protein [Bacillus sp. 3103sda1]